MIEITALLFLSACEYKNFKGGKIVYFFTSKKSISINN